jgi:hypothetical protein
MGKAALAAAALSALLLQVDLAAAGPKLDAAASDPTTIGWMLGSPPAPDKIVGFNDGSYWRFPQIRWSFSHMRQLIPSVPLSHQDTQIHPLPKRERSDIDGVQFLPLGSSEPMTWAQSLAANYTDGIVVMHRGRIIYERYFGALKPDGEHSAMSVGKSFVGTCPPSAPLRQIEGSV